MARSGNQDELKALLGLDEKGRKERADAREKKRRGAELATDSAAASEREAAASVGASSASFVAADRNPAAFPASEVRLTAAEIAETEEKEMPAAEAQTAHGAGRSSFFSRRHRVVRSETSRDPLAIQSRRAQRRILERSIRKATIISAVLALLSGGLLYLTNHGWQYYRAKTADEGAEKGYLSEFLRYGLRGNDDESAKPYLSNREKVLRRLAAEQTPRQEGNASDKGEQDRAAAAAAVAPSRSLSAEEIAAMIRSGKLAQLANEPSPDYRAMKGLFDAADYEDVRRMLAGKDTVQGMSKVEGGYEVQYPYLKLFAAAEYPLLPKSEKAADDFFDDACFIGDSIFSIFSAGAPYDADYFTRPLMTTETALDKFDFRNKKGDEGSIRELLGKSKYKKIYFLLGTNEGPIGSTVFIKQYRAMLDSVRALQPEAQFYLLALFPVSADYEEEGRFPTNGMFTEMNRELMQLCRETGSFFLDYGSTMRGAYGVLPSEAATDGIHFTLRYVPAWTEYISTHTFQGALGLRDAAIRPPTPEEEDSRLKKEEDEVPNLDAQGGTSDSPDGVVDLDAESADKTGETASGDKGDKNKKADKTKTSGGANAEANLHGQVGQPKGQNQKTELLEGEHAEHAEQAEHQANMAFPEEGKTTPSVEQLSAVYTRAFAETDPAVTQKLDALYKNIRENIRFEDSMSSIKISKIPAFYGIDLKKLTDARILRSTGATAEEMLLLRFHNESEAQDARQTLALYVQSRIESYRDYVPAELDKLNKAQPVVQGKYLYLIIATDSQRLSRFIED